MRKAFLANMLIAVLAIVGVGWWCDYRSRVIAEEAIAEQENRELEFWRDRLLPLYRQMGMEHKENPTTKYSGSQLR